MYGYHLLRQNRTDGKQDEGTTCLVGRQGVPGGSLGRPPHPRGHGPLWALKVCGLCNYVNLQGGWVAVFQDYRARSHGDRLVQFAHRVQRTWKKVGGAVGGRTALTSERKRMTVLYDLESPISTKGRGGHLARSQFLHGENERALLTASQRKQIAEAARRWPVMRCGMAPACA